MNQTPKDMPSQATFKKGDIVWVLYRGKEFYPARVNAFYPKERKISHIWFPLNRKSINAIFKADMGKVRPFTIEDDLPDNASQELEYSYDQAIRIMQGTSIEKILEENDRMMEEMGIPLQKSAKKNSSKKSLNTSDVIHKSVSSPKSTPRAYKAQRNSVYQHEVIEEPPEPQFAPGDPIIVDTSIGMWPGIFHSYAEDVGPDSDDIRYTLFPRDPSSDILMGKKSSIVHFPLSHIEQSINEGVGSEMLMEALRDALQYVKVRNAQQEAASAGKHLGVNISSQNEHFLKTLPTPSDVKNVTPVVSTQIIAPSKSVKSAAIKKQSVPAQKIAPRTKELKKEIITKQDEELSDSPTIDSTTVMTPVAVNPKNKSFFTDKRFRLSSASSVEAVSPTVTGYQPPSEKKAKSSNISNDLTEEEKQHQLELFPEKETPNRESTTSGTSSNITTTNYKQIPKKPAQHNGHLNSPLTTVDLPQTLQNESEPMDIEPKQSKSTSQQKHLIGTNFVGKQSFFELASSEDAHQHMRQIWGEYDEAWFKEILNVEFLQLDFRNGGLLTFKETEKLFLEVEKWIKMESITAMNNFRQSFYIAKYVLPELCTFALSKMQDISMMDARRIYEERREKTKHQTGLNSSSPNFLDTLVMAANMKMAEEKNGGTNEAK